MPASIVDLLSLRLKAGVDATNAGGAISLVPVTKGREAIPLFREPGLAVSWDQAIISRPAAVLPSLEQWFKMIRLLRPDCPAKIHSSGMLSS